MTLAVDSTSLSLGLRSCEVKIVNLTQGGCYKG